MKHTNVQRVRLLYKTVLRLHRGLPSELAELGTIYAKDEFKRHKKCSAKEADIFISEWSRYAVSLAKQLGVKTTLVENQNVGASLTESDLRMLRDEQIYQLHELMVASKGDDKSR